MYPGSSSSHGGCKGIGQEAFNVLIKFITVCRYGLMLNWEIFGGDVPEEEVSMPMKQDS